MPSFLYPTGEFEPQPGKSTFYPQSGKNTFYAARTNSFLSADGTFFKSLNTGAPVSTASVLTGGPVADPAAMTTSLKAINNGGFAITINGTVRQIGPINFTSITGPTQAAALIDGALGTYADCYWNVSRFVIVNKSRGPTSTITVASAPASGTNIATICCLTAATGAVTVAGTKGEEEEKTDAHERAAKPAKKADIPGVQGGHAALGTGHEGKAGKAR